MRRMAVSRVSPGAILRAHRGGRASNGLEEYTRVVELDRELVERSRGGDRAAFEELVRRTARLVFARAYLETGDNLRAEDLTQETFLLAWRSVRKVKDAELFRPWLMSILHRVVVDAARREGRKKRGG